MKRTKGFFESIFFTILSTFGIVFIVTLLLSKASLYSHGITVEGTILEHKSSLKKNKLRHEYKIEYGQHTREFIENTPIDSEFPIMIHFLPDEPLNAVILNDKKSLSDNLFADLWFVVLIFLSFLFVFCYYVVEVIKLCFDPTVKQYFSRYLQGAKMLGKNNNQLNKHMLIKSLLDDGIKSDAFLQSMGVASEYLDEMALMGTHEATIVTIVESVHDLLKQGLTLEQAIQRIEIHRNQFSPHDIKNIPNTIPEYVYFRLKLEESNGPRKVDEDHIKKSTLTAMKHYG